MSESTAELQATALAETGRPRGRGLPISSETLSRLTVIGIRSGAVAFNFVVQVVLARVMRLPDFGVVATALALVNIAAVPASLGYDSAAIRFVALAREDRSALVTLTRRLAPGVATASAVVAAVLAAVSLAEWVYGDVRLAGATAVLVLVVPTFAVVRVAEGWLRGAGSVLGAQINSGLVIPGLSVLLVVAAALFAHDHRISPVVALALRAAATAVAALVVVMLVRRRVGRASAAPTPATVPSRSELKRTGLVLCGGSAVTMILMQIDVVAVSYIAGSSRAGIYGAASRIAAALNVTVVGANFILSPRVARLFHDRQRADLQREVYAAAGWMALTMGACCAVVGIAAGPILHVFGSHFADGSTALRLLLVGQFVNGVTGPAGTVLTMTGHQSKAFVAYVCAAAIDVLGLAVLVPTHGIVGAAVATTVAAVIVNVVMVFQVKQAVGVWTVPSFAPLRRLIPG